MRNTGRATLMLAAVLSSGPVRADFWDQQTVNDNQILTTPNELVHGSDQIHDLATPASGGGDETSVDVDWFRLRQEGSSSYEIVVEATSGDVAPGPGMLRRTSGTGTEMQSSVPISTSIGLSLSLRWQTESTPLSDQRIQVMPGPGGCVPACDANDVYRIRAFDTTYAIARFNNSGSQNTVLVVQNPAAYAVQATAWFWNDSGIFLANKPFTLQPKAVYVLSTPTVPGVAGMSGSITISNTARYGDLVGKAVSMESGSGYSFDTPMTPRVR